MEDIKKVVSIRLSNKAEWIASFQIAHDFLNSHGRKRKEHVDSLNYAISLDENGNLVKDHYERDLEKDKELVQLFDKHKLLIKHIAEIKKDIKLNYSNEERRKLLQATLASYKQDEQSIYEDVSSHLLAKNNLALKHYKHYLDFEERAKTDWKEFKGRAMQGNTNLFINGIITFGNEESNLSRLELEELDQDELDKAAYNSVKRIANENGVNVLYLTKHLDETQIHYHYALENYNFTEHKTLAVQMRAKSSLKSLQDLVAEEFEYLGFYRGKSSDIRLSEYLDSNNLTKEEFFKLSYTEKQSIYKTINSKRIEDYKQSTVAAKDALYLQKKALQELEQKQQEILRFKEELQVLCKRKPKI